MKNLSSYLNQHPNLRCEENADTSRLTTFRVGGSCEYALYPQNAEELMALLAYFQKEKHKYTVLGNGSNVVFCDGHYDGAVVLTRELRSITVSGNTITAECGALLKTVCDTALTISHSGLEFACGIPGSTGGAVFMNAGAYGGEMKDVLSEVTSFDPVACSAIKRKADDCGLGYRTSIFQTNGEIILSAEMKLTEGEYNTIQAAMNENLAKRRDKQPLNYPSAGSAFKRYPGRYTGQMIDEAGLRGLTVGGAQVSEKHCGFIVNRGGASCADIEELVSIIKEKIRQREGVDIECEIRFIK